MRQILIALLGLAAVGVAPGCRGRSSAPAAQSPDEPPVRNDQLDTQLAMMAQLLESTEVTDPDYPEMVLRLAELHFEYRDFMVEQGGQHRQAIERARASGDQARASALTNELRAMDQYAREMADKGITMLRLFVDKLAPGPSAQRDEVLTTLVKELDRIGRPSEADRYRAQMDAEGSS